MACSLRAVAEEHCEVHRVDLFAKWNAAPIRLQPPRVSQAKHKVVWNGAVLCAAAMRICLFGAKSAILSLENQWFYHSFQTPNTDSYWRGPGKVLERLGEVIYRVRLCGLHEAHCETERLSSMKEAPPLQLMTRFVSQSEPLMLKSGQISCQNFVRSFCQKCLVTVFSQMLMYAYIFLPNINVNYTQIFPEKDHLKKSLKAQYYSLLICNFFLTVLTVLIKGFEM